jgi:bifunctional aspartokinase / homoserine dehydrogenase 2
MQFQTKQSLLQQAQVHKFGGSSLASAQRFAAVADIILAQDCTPPLWVVVSAPGNTTDALLDIIASAKSNADYAQASAALQQQLGALVSATLPAAAAQPVITQLQHWFAAIPAALAQQQDNDVLAIGERLSALLLCQVLKQRALHAIAVDARDFLRLKRHQPDWKQSAALLSTLQQPTAVHVVTGYIARDEQGRSITLGRNGSDYSATLLGALVDAGSVTIWTDVKAIYSADPRKVKQSIPYQQVSWSQACQLAQLGNPVLHARTLSPLTGSKTALIVRSSYQPQLAGCTVQQHDVTRQGFVTELTDVTLLTLHQAASISSCDLALQLQQPVIALPHQGDNSSWLLPSVCAEEALAYLSRLNINAVWDTQRYCALAYLKPHDTAPTAAAETLLQQYGVLHRYETAQQVIWLLPATLDAPALETLHQQLLQPLPVLKLVVAGTGNVGAEFLSMLKAQQQRLASVVKLELAGVLNSRQAILTNDVQPADWQPALAAGGCWNDNSLLAYLNALSGPKALIDITPSRDVAAMYPAVIATGCDIISANKQGVTLPAAEYCQIQQALARHKRQWFSNTACGAGIPVQRTLQELRSAGDNIIEISGIFSGTLSWLLCQFDGSKPFSEFVLDAQQAGLTEPDPRDDLSGKDVQRKLLVLARELDVQLELDDIALDPLLPDGLQHGSWQDFWAQRAVLDDLMAKRYARGQQSSTVLRYVGSLSLKDGKARASVSLQQVNAQHPLKAIAPCDNVFVIRSAWYDINPLVLKGPGAGRVVTAGGLHADLAILVQQIAQAASQQALLA